MKSDFITSTLHHLRPGLWPFIWLHAMAGFIAANGRHALTLGPETWLQGMVAGANFAVFLGGPAALLTGYFTPRPSVADGAEADASRDPTPMPRNACLVAFAMVLLGLIVAMAITWNYFDICLMGLIVLVAHAAPPLRLVEMNWGALAAQAFGLGALAFAAGFYASDAPSAYGNTAPLYVFGFIFLFLALRLAFWRAHDRMAPWSYWVALGAAFTCLARAGFVGGNRWSMAAFILPIGFWCAAGIFRLECHPSSRIVGVILGAWVLTDAAVIAGALVRAQG